MRGVTYSLNAILNFIAISTHTPHARRDDLNRQRSEYAILFQLTRLMRGVTRLKNGFIYENPNFNSHASCEA